MPKFKDAAGREWVWPKITSRLLSVLRDKFGVNLRDLLRKDTTEIALAISDDEKVIDLLFFLCADQVEDQRATRESVEEAFGEVTNLAARESLMEAFFTFSQGAKKAAQIMQGIRASSDTTPTSPPTPNSSAASTEPS